LSVGCKTGINALITHSAIATPSPDFSSDFFIAMKSGVFLIHSADASSERPCNIAFERLFSSGNNPDMIQRLLH